MSRYRRLRGMALHVLPHLRQEGIPQGRILMPWRDFPSEKQKGRCRWCRLSIEPEEGKHYWHEECETQMRAVIGWRVSPTIHHEAYCRLCRFTHQVCPGCGRGHRDRTLPIAAWEIRYGQRLSPLGYELEHEHPIHLAREEGPKSLVRAFLLENLRWLCDDCHRVKTRAEQGEAAKRRRWAANPQPQLFSLTDC